MNEEAPKKERKKRVWHNDDFFFKTWNESSSVAEAASALNMDRGAAYRRAKVLRARGKELKSILVRKKKQAAAA